MIFSIHVSHTNQASQVQPVLKNPPANAGHKIDTALTPGSGRSPGGTHGDLLQDSWLETPRDRGAWRANSPWGRTESDTIEAGSSRQAVMVIILLLVFFFFFWTRWTAEHAPLGEGLRACFLWSASAPACVFLIWSLSRVWVGRASWKNRPRGHAACLRPLGALNLPWGESVRGL